MFIALFLVILILAIAVIHMLVNVYPIMRTVSCEEMKNTATVILNDALKSVVGGDISSEEIVKVSVDENKNVTAISVDSIRINAIARDATLIAQSKLKSIGELQVKIPIGTLSGITFLSGLGPSLTVRCASAGSVNVRFKSSFDSSGINNTRYSVMMIANTTMNVIIPGLTQTVDLQIDVPIVDTIIIGKVPDTYLNSNQLDEMLNLVP